MQKTRFSKKLSNLELFYVMANSCVVNEVLCFCSTYYGKTPKGEIIDTLVGFYDDKEIESAKETLFNIVRGLSPKIDDLPRCRTRKDGSNKRRLDSDDLLSLIEFVDKKNVELPPVYASDVRRIPSFAPSMVDNVRLADSIVKLQQQLSDVVKELAELKSAVKGNRNSDDITATTVEMIADVHDVHDVDTDQKTVPSTGQSYATLFQSKDDQGQWFMVTKNKPKPTAVSRKITGKGSGCGNSSLKAAAPSGNKPRNWYCFVGRLDPDTTEDDVNKHLGDAGIAVVSCSMLKKTQKWQEKYAAFHVVVEFAYKDLMFDDALWPIGTDVRDWVFTNSK